MPLDPDDSPGFLLWQVTLRWQRDIAAALAPLDLTHVQFVLLATAWWLNSAGEDPNQLALARRAGTDVKMTSQVLRKLETKGLIRRETDAADTRAKRLHVTDRGAELAVQAIAAVEAADAAFFRAPPDPAPATPPTAPAERDAAPKEAAQRRQTSGPRLAQGRSPRRPAELRLKARVVDADEMALDTRSSKTVRVRK